MTTTRSEAPSVVARGRWWSGLPAVSAEIACGGQRHRITWRRGRLVLEDHDVLAERTLAALGSEPPLCIEVLDGWRRICGSEQLHGFLLAERALSNRELALRQRLHHTRMERATQPPPSFPPQAGNLKRQFERHLAERREREERMWHLTLIEALPAALRGALALSVIVSVERHWHHAEYRRTHREHIEPALAAITRPLLEQSARRWRRNLRPYARFTVESRLLAPGEPPGCAGSVGAGGACAVLSLPLSWFIEIWPRGAALVDGCFVLGRTGGSLDQTSFAVQAVRWERRTRHSSKSVKAPALLTRHADGAWSLEWM